MTESRRDPPRPADWPDDAGSPEGRKSMRDDVGASLERPRAEDTPPADRIEPSGQRGPAGAGRVAGRGKLGTPTAGEKGTEQGPR